MLILVQTINLLIDPKRYWSYIQVTFLVFSQKFNYEPCSQNSINFKKEWNEEMREKFLLEILYCGIPQWLHYKATFKNFESEMRFRSKFSQMMHFQAETFMADLIQIIYELRELCLKFHQLEISNVWFPPKNQKKEQKETFFLQFSLFSSLKNFMNSVLFDLLILTVYSDKPAQQFDLC